jgi:hypothetical protein
VKYPGVHAPDVMLQVMGGSFQGSKSLDLAAPTANKGNEALVRAVGRLQARHSSEANAVNSMPQRIKGRQLAAGTPPGYFRLST